MQIEVGQIIEGKVVGITKFGVFVDLGEGKSGLVHISEIAQTYVSDVKEFVKENDTVKMKVLNISEDGKISLSIKRAMLTSSLSAKRIITAVHPAVRDLPSPLSRIISLLRLFGLLRRANLRLLRI